MNRFGLLGLSFCLSFLSAPLGAVLESTAPVETSSYTVEVPQVDQTTSSEESEAKDIIPHGARAADSSSPLPTSGFTPQTPYDQAREELIQAFSLWSAGQAEAASDKALEAYDDLVELRRVPGVKRSKIRSLLHQAASVYTEAGIAYVKSYVRKAGGTPEAIQEGRARLEDLRDVAMGYLELNRMLNRAIEQLPASAGVKSPPK